MKCSHRWLAPVAFDACLMHLHYRTDWWTSAGPAPTTLPLCATNSWLLRWSSPAQTVAAWPAHSAWPVCCLSVLVRLAPWAPAQWVVLAAGGRGCHATPQRGRTWLPGPGVWSSTPARGSGSSSSMDTCTAADVFYVQNSTRRAGIACVRHREKACVVCWGGGALLYNNTVTIS